MLTSVWAPVSLLFWLVVGSTVWVGFDSSAHKVATSSKKPYSPGTVGVWVVCCLLLWIVAFPFYLVRRSRTLGG
jgi:hypothetical protein